MDRQRKKIISALLALLMVVSPITSLAMQPAMAESHSGHCSSPETDSDSFQQGIQDLAQCTMESCAESCSASRHCSNQAPVILTRTDADACAVGSSHDTSSVYGTHLPLHPSGLYRPPRA